jgi:predicted transcriptional regulator
VKTAISISDEIFNKAEELAESLGISRSELYTQAIANFIPMRVVRWMKE